MQNVNPPSERLYGVMQALLAAYAQKAPAPSAEPRGVVEEQDALDAVMNLAAVLDKNLRDGRLSENNAAHMAALLMLIRDHLRPLPAGPPAEDAGADRVTADLREFVDGLRAARAETGMRG
ncbi:hypothetical protein V2S66_05880 [Streptomyces sp. V4-01]|uniref:DUF1844 domain-containing protein n=1 Tax=Actinacidiphila polyblastidii TaxID=3110430 RepID=A0ABU7P755_9ACTN|nr:hypothetical protein [Streptomyces sp. V4-01]